MRLIFMISTLGLFIGGGLIVWSSWSAMQDGDAITFASVQDCQALQTPSLRETCLNATQPASPMLAQAGTAMAKTAKLRPAQEADASANPAQAQAQVLADVAPAAGADQDSVFSVETAAQREARLEREFLQQQTAALIARIEGLRSEAAALQRQEDIAKAPVMAADDVQTQQRRPAGEDTAAATSTAAPRPPRHTVTATTAITEPKPVADPLHVVQPADEALEIAAANVADKPVPTPTQDPQPVTEALPLSDTDTIAAPQPGAAKAKPLTQVAEALKDIAPAAAKESVLPAFAKAKKGVKYLVVGSFQERKRANKLAAQFQSHKPTLLTTLVKKKPYHRVVVGPFAKADIPQAKAYFLANGVRAPWTMDNVGN